MNLQSIKKFDKGNVIKTYKDIEKQFEQVFKEFKSVKVPTNFKNVNKIVVCGMGGSILGADLIRNIFSKNIKIPIFIVNDYELPKWVDDKTLIIVSSFSGNTEETISCCNEAIKKKLNIFIICGGGELSDFNFPKYVYDPIYNYAQNPRFAIGYSVAILISLFKKLGFLKFNIKNLKEDISYFKKSEKNSEKLAKKLKNKILIIISSEHLQGNAHIFQNQLNETGKNFATYFSIPEICHHQLEGLSFPKDLNKNIIYILLESEKYHLRNQKRYQILKNILRKKKIKFLEIKAFGLNSWQESLYILGLSSYISFYLAYYNKIDPQPNPWVDFLKQKMKKE